MALDMCKAMAGYDARAHLTRHMNALQKPVGSRQDWLVGAETAEGENFTDGINIPSSFVFNRVNFLHKP
ncbi:MAG: hypothetical protein ABSB19_08825 [Methylomonas sp.]|jgi:hypothetical protein